MSYRLKFREPLSKAVRRIVREQLSAAAHLIDSGEEPVRAVHEARKGLKRTRALLRLVREGLEPAEFKLANQRMRDIARRVSATRDRDVLTGVLASIVERGGPRADSAGRLLAALELEPAPQTHRAGKPVVADLTHELSEAIASVENLSLAPAKFKTVARGLARSHRAGQRALSRVLGEPENEEALHDLRKAAQIHWRHMLLVNRAWPVAARARADRAKRIADMLGDDHDLGLLKAALAGGLDASLSPADRRGLETLAEECQQALRQSALPLAGVLFAEDSAAVGRRYRRLWSAAARQARSEAEEHGSRRQQVSGRHAKLPARPRRAALE